MITTYHRILYKTTKQSDSYIVKISLQTIWDKDVPWWNLYSRSQWLHCRLCCTSKRWFKTRQIIMRTAHLTWIFISLWASQDHLPDVQDKQRDSGKQSPSKEHPRPRFNAVTFLRRQHNQFDTVDNVSHQTEPHEECESHPTVPIQVWCAGAINIVPRTLPGIDQVLCTVRQVDLGTFYKDKEHVQLRGHGS